MNQWPELGTRLGVLNGNLWVVAPKGQGRAAILWSPTETGPSAVAQQRPFRLSEHDLKRVSEAHARFPLLHL